MLLVVVPEQHMWLDDLEQGIASERPCIRASVRVQVLSQRRSDNLHAVDIVLI